MYRKRLYIDIMNYDTRHVYYIKKSNKICHYMTSTRIRV
jgi:hypothetical protein